MERQHDGLDKHRKLHEKRVRKLYRALFNESLPKNWTIITLFSGLTNEGHRNLLLPDGLPIGNREALETVCHEFLHIVAPMMEHGKAYDKLVKQLLRAARKVKL